MPRPAYGWPATTWKTTTPPRSSRRYAAAAGSPNGWTPRSAELVPGLRERLVDLFDGDRAQAFDRSLRRIGTRNQRGREAELGGLAQPLLAAWRRPDLARQANLAEDGQAAWQGPVAQGRHHRQQHGEVSRRLGDPDPANRVDEDILVEAGDAGVPMQHRQQHGEAIVFEPDAEPARIGHMGGIDERLDLDQQRPRAFLRHQHAGSRHLALALREEQRGWIGHPAQPAVGHGEDTQLVDRAKAVLEGAHQAIGGV